MKLKNKILVNSSIHPKLRFFYIPYSIRDKLYNYHASKKPKFHKHINLKTNPKLSNLVNEGNTIYDKLEGSIVNKTLIDIDKLPSQLGQNGKTSYKHEDLLKKGILLDYVFSTDLLSLIEAFFGCAPKIQYLAAWTISEGIETNEMFFHPDRHGHKFVKFFVYLNDVNENDGHHEMIPFSQQSNFKSYIKKVPLDVRRAMLEKSKKGWYKKIKLKNELFTSNSNVQIKKIFGESGTCFLEDTSCFHRGTQVLPNFNKRTIFQILFTPWDNEKDIVKKIEMPDWVGKFRDRPEVMYAINHLFSEK